MHGHHDHHRKLEGKEVEILLKHMLEHNKSHSQELHQIAHGLEEEKQRLLHDVVRLYEEADRRFEEALHSLEVL